MTDERAVRLAFGVVAAKADVKHATQALHDIRGLLGFDNDGDQTPGARIAGARSVEKYAQQVVDDVREYVADEDARNREDDDELERLRGVVERLELEKFDLIERLIQQGGDPT